MICKPSCVKSSFPKADIWNKCKKIYRKGGITRLIFLLCDPDMELPYEGGWENVDNWTWALCNNFIFISGPILGQQPKAAFTKKRFESCGTEQMTSKQFQVNFLDYNADTEDLEDFDFWAAIEENKDFLLMGYIDCNELVYLWDNEWGLEISPVKEDTSEGSSYRDGSLLWSMLGEIKPFKVPGILNTLESFVAAECY